MKLQLFLSKILSFLGENATNSEVKIPEGDTYKESYYYKVIQPVVEIINQLMLPAIIVLGALGSVLAIFLGVQYAKAESTDKRDEAKKRLINGIIGVVVMLVILILMKLLAANADVIAKWVTESV